MALYSMNKARVVPFGTKKSVAPVAKCGCGHATAQGVVELNAAKRRYGEYKRKPWVGAAELATTEHPGTPTGVAPVNQ